MPVIPDPQRNARTAWIAAAGTLGMLGLAYAAVPLYSLFCQATGFGGTTQRAAAAPLTASARSISVRFDANTASALNWNFRPAQTAMRVKLGAPSLARYLATSTAALTTTGTAVFNVTPPQAGIYFNKVECFCFTEQTLKPGETAELPVMFFVDPDILRDADLKTLDEIVLSYTFYPAGAARPVAQTN